MNQTYQVKITSRPDSPNWVMYFVDPLTGRERCRSARTKDRKEAERAAARWETELAAGHASQTCPSWDQFRIRFENEHLLAAPNRTRNSYIVALNAFERVVGCPTSIAAITSEVLSRFAAGLRADKLAETTIGNRLRHVRSALSWASKLGLLQRVPHVMMPKTVRRRLMRGRPLTASEYQRFLGAVPAVVGTDAPGWQRLIVGLWASGLRLGEALQLSWSTPPVRADLEGATYPRIVWHGEGQKSRQDAITPMTPDLAALLREVPVNERVGLVFPLRLGSRNVRDVFLASRTISRIGRESGIQVADDGKFASAHDLRRSFGTRWALQVKPLVLKTLMRHQSIATTMQYYVDADADDIAAALWLACEREKEGQQ